MPVCHCSTARSSKSRQRSQPDIPIGVNPYYGDPCTSSTDSRQDQLRHVTKAASGAAQTLAATQKQLHRGHRPGRRGGGGGGFCRPDLSHAVYLWKHTEIRRTSGGGLYVVRSRNDGQHDTPPLLPPPFPSRFRTKFDP